jgi:antitoxin MazE
MRIPLVAIGNSRGVRLPKAVLQQCALAGEVDLQVTDGRVILAPVRAVRAGWAAAFAAAGDDPLLDEAEAHALTPRQAREWTW